ncbi:hypothetical protein PAAG_11770 [Paracoccidioides lutzii Pb01]|uniref:Uncharacterized protein n=1 Tax=Paracoccidioides lutzii (strain ATCC MYA-826 / Pb01) TaxID=502779 RepID=A0A0A2V208_PARBA|nr:hypothetical protein PAAG_11770 [Paracoccidioides lutzii Pb01]KGQ01533.1 hypothetical protein PAAG_11770 [Paracoccidioides lutzii Pb01]
MPLFDKEDTLSDKTPSDSSTLYRVSRREKFQHESKKLKGKLTHHIDESILRMRRQRI